MGVHKTSMNKFSILYKLNQINSFEYFQNFSVSVNIMTVTIPTGT